MPNDFEEMMDPKAVCKILRISRTKFYRMVADGEIEAVRVGQEYRVTPSALHRFIQAGKQERASA